MHRSCRLLPLFLLCALALCAHAVAAPAGLGGAKKFSAYSVYYGGGKVAGLPLDHVEGGRGPEGEKADDSSAVWTFVYGKCKPKRGEPACPPPLQIQNWSSCRRWPAAFDKKAKIHPFRGAKARGSGNGIADPIEVFTGRTTVVIYAEQKSVATAAAQHLIDVKASGPEPRLPAPAKGSLQGDLPCQVVPG